MGSRERLANPKHKVHRVSRGSHGLIIGLAGAHRVSQTPIGTNHRVLQELIGSLKGSQAPIIGSDYRDLQGLMGLAGACSGSLVSQRPVGTNHRVSQGLMGLSRAQRFSS